MGIRGFSQPAIFTTTRVRALDSFIFTAGWQFYYIMLLYSNSYTLRNDRMITSFQFNTRETHPSSVILSSPESTSI